MCWSLCGTTSIEAFEVEWKQQYPPISLACTGAARRGNESAFGDANLEKEEEKAEDEVVVDTMLGLLAAALVLHLMLSSSSLQ